MGWHLPLIALLVVLAIGRHGVSATDCFSTNCEFVVREECQTSESVICSLKDRPNKQVNITAASFPRDVREIEISDADVITFEPDTIASLTSLQFIEITNVNTLVLLPRSLARGLNPERITVTIRAVKSVKINAMAFSGWKYGSRITIENVDDCQMLSFSVAYAQVRSLTLNKISSLVINENTFDDQSKIREFRAMNIGSLSIKNNSFPSTAAAHNVWFKGIATFTIHTGALSRNSRIQKARMEEVKYLDIESGGIEADIDELKLTDVAMETCAENTFGGSVASLSLSSSHVNRTRKNCISAGNGMKKLIIESSHLDQIDASSIYGRVTEVHIKDSTIGTIEKEGLQLNVKKFSIENSIIEKASEKTFVVLADNEIIIRDCTIGVMQRGAFSSLSVMQGNGTARRIQLDNLHIKHPQNGSLQFDQNQKMKLDYIELDIPCKCDIATALGLDATSENEFWINETLCEVNNSRSPLAYYLKEFCTEPTTTPQPTTDCPTTTPPPTTTIKADEEDVSTFQNPDELNAQDPQTIPETRDQTPGDGSDQVRTGSTHGEVLAATIAAAVLIMLVVLGLLVRDLSKARLWQSQKKWRSFWYASISNGSHRQTHGPNPLPESSAPNRVDVSGSADTASCQASVQTASTCQTSVGSVGTHTRRGTKMERGSKGTQHNPPATQSLTGAPGESQHHRAVGGDVGNEDGDRAPYRGVAENSRPAHSAGPDSTHTSHVPGQLEIDPLIPCLIPSYVGADGEWWTQPEAPARGESAHLQVTEYSDTQPSPPHPGDPYL